MNKKNITIKKPTLQYIDNFIINYEEDNTINPDKEKQIFFNLEEEQAYDKRYFNAQKLLFKKVLLNNDACCKLLGMKDSKGTRHLTRYSLPDFCYDLLTYISSTELKLMQEDKIQPAHFLYQNIIKKLDIPELDRDFSLTTTMIYAQNDIAPHWNRVSQLTEEQINEVIIEDCYSKGISSFNILSNVFNPHHFIHATETKKLNSTQEISYSLSEKILCAALTNSTVKFNQHKLMLDTLHELGAKENYNKIQYIIDLKNINYSSLIAMNNSELENTLFPIKLSNKYSQNFSLLEIVKLNYVANSLNNCLSGKKSIGFDSKNYTTLLELIAHFKEDQFLNKHMGNFFQAKSENSTSKEQQVKWRYIALQLLPINKHNKHESVKIKI